MSLKHQRVEFGDFQTPDSLAYEICQKLYLLGVQPDTVIEPTCGVGSFVIAAATSFPEARDILGFDINGPYLERLRTRINAVPNNKRIRLKQTDFFAEDWRKELSQYSGRILVIGNFPWVTNAVQTTIGGANLPEKSNFLGRNGFDAISGKANFDISEWMLLEVIRWLDGRDGDVAMLVKTSVARKILSHAKQQGTTMEAAYIIRIDAKKEFGVQVDACLLVMRFSCTSVRCYDYTVFDSLTSIEGHLVGHRMGLTVRDLKAFDDFCYLVGESPQKWRSGVKHDASAVMELSSANQGLENGLGELVNIEPDYLFPLLKGSDVGSGKEWRGKYLLVTQQRLGQSTEPIKNNAPKTWEYLSRHAEILDKRGSTIYVKNPRFSVFGIGDYSFRPWKVAICGLYKKLRFQLVGPINGKPVMFDDTVYYVSFDSEDEAREVLGRLTSRAAICLLSSLVFPDEKRPIKTGILNVLDWNKVSLDDQNYETLGSKK